MHASGTRIGAACAAAVVMLAVGVPSAWAADPPFYPRTSVSVGGTARSHGSTGNLLLAAPIVDIARTPSGRGYWELAGDGGVFTYGDARFHGSTGNLRLVSPAVQ